MSAKVQIQGHRGARGLFPENTLTGFVEAVKLGVDVIEMDLVISADRQVVVSHEAWMNPEFCSSPGGEPIQIADGRRYNLFKMDYSAIKEFDCGKRGNEKFPGQKKMPAHKPLFSEVLNVVEAFTKQNQLSPVCFNVELKSETPYGLFNPPPSVFAELVCKEISRCNFMDRITVQSFDHTILTELKKIEPGLRLGLLVEHIVSLQNSLDRLGFIPDAFNPEYSLVTPDLVEAVHQKHMLINAWTVNSIVDMRSLLTCGVDGIITDYPERAISLIASV